MTSNSQPWRILPGKGWGPIEIGMTRNEVLHALRKAKAKVEEEDNDDPDYLDCDAPWGDFHFEGEGGRLSQINVYESPITFGEPMEEPTLDAVLTAVGANSFNDTRWVCPKLSDYPPEDADKTLLRLGELWLISTGLGLEMHNGEVGAVYIRREQDAPESTLGPLTPAQLEIVATPELREALRPAHVSGAQLQWGPPSPTYVWLSRLVHFCFVAFLLSQSYRAYQAEIRWKGALPIEGEIVKTLPEGDAFPDAYLIQYTPPEGALQQTRLESKFMGGMRKVGEKVEIRYLPNHPEQATTIWEAHDHPVLDYLLATFYVAAAYCVLLVALNFLR